MVDVDPNIRVYEAQFFGLDNFQDDAEGNIQAYGAQVDKILVVLDRQNTLGSLIKQEVGAMKTCIFNGMFMLLKQRHVHVVVNIRSTM